jgi:hypothetical protein
LAKSAPCRGSLVMNQTFLLLTTFSILFKRET